MTNRQKKVSAAQAQHQEALSGRVWMRRIKHTAIAVGGPSILVGLVAMVVGYEVFKAQVENLQSLLLQTRDEVIRLDERRKTDAKVIDQLDANLTETQRYFDYTSAQAKTKLKLLDTASDAGIKAVDSAKVQVAHIVSAVSAIKNSEQTLIVLRSIADNPKLAEDISRLDGLIQQQQRQPGKMMFALRSNKLVAQTMEDKTDARIVQRPDEAYALHAPLEIIDGMKPVAVDAFFEQGDEITELDKCEIDPDGKSVKLGDTHPMFEGWKGSPLDHISRPPMYLVYICFYTNADLPTTQPAAHWEY